MINRFVFFDLKAQLSIKTTLCMLLLYALACPPVGGLSLQIAKIMAIFQLHYKLQH